MAIKTPDSNQLVKVLIVGLVFMFLITSVIDFNAISSDDENAKIFKENVNYENLVPQVYTWLIVGAAVWIAWTMSMRTGATITRKSLLSLVVLGVVLYFLYNNVLVGSGFLPDLKPIEFAAYQLQSVVTP